MGRGAGGVAGVREGGCGRSEGGCGGGETHITYVWAVCVQHLVCVVFGWMSNQ